jgi:hypothetical protein
VTWQGEKGAGSRGALRAATAAHSRLMLRETKLWPSQGNLHRGDISSAATCACPRRRKAHLSSPRKEHTSIWTIVRHRRSVASPFDTCETLGAEGRTGGAKWLLAT